MRLLLVTYYFPPAGGGGVQRVLGWCRHLPDHHVEVTVVAPRAPRWIDVDPTLVIPASTRVLRTDDPSPPAVIPADALAQVGPARRVLRRAALQPRRLSIPDIHRRWRRPAVRAALAAASPGSHAGPPWDAVLSSSPPETCHLIAHDLSHALGIPWIADFRDSWLDLPHLRLSRLDVRLKQAANERLASRLLAHASAATTVSEPLAHDLRARHPHLPVHVIENGVELGEVARAADRADGFREPGRFLVTYTGNFFGVQSPASFLDGVEHALAEVPELGQDLLVRFIGGLKAVDRDRVARGRLSTVVEHLGFLRRDDVLAHQQAADLLLLYVAPGSRSQGVYTGKVFEYVAARRPVLALAPGDNVAAALLERARSTATGGGRLVDPRDPVAIGSALVSAWSSWSHGGGRTGIPTPDVDVPQSVLQEIDRRAGTGRLASLLESLR